MSYSSETGKNTFRENRLIQSWQGGRPTLNGWLAIPDACTAEAMAHAGWDSLTIDMQHGLVDYSDAITMLIAMAATPVVPMIRVPWLEEGIIMKSLDAGAYGIICPMINNKNDAERFARACRYPPSGIRSFGPVRAKLYAGNDYDTRANDTVLAIAMIETREALDNLESILSVEEINAVYIGPADLSLALGAKPTFDQEDPLVLAAIKQIITTSKKMKKWVGIHNGTVAYAQKMIQQGADFVTVGSDLRLLSGAAKQIVDKFRNKT